MRSSRGPDIELRLRIPPGRLAHLLKLPILTGTRPGPPSTRRLVSTYFDTPDFRLMRRRMALRVREEKGQHVQVVKAAPSGKAGPLVREAARSKVAGDRPEPARLEPGRQLRKVFSSKKATKRLAPVFVTDIKRRSWPISVAKSDLELAVDVGRITARTGSVQICEAEIELKSGSIGDVYKLARALRKDVALVVEPRSKADRGYGLIGDVPGPVRRVRIRLGAGATLGEAFLRIGRTCLAQLRASEAVLRARPQAEAVHQFRVALRRLRSALTIFRSRIDTAERNRIAGDLRWLAAQFGRAREWDVFLDGLLARVRAGVPRDPALTVLVAAAATARERAYRQLYRVLESARYADVMLDVESWWEAGPWTRSEGKAWAEPARPAARQALRRLHRKLARLDRDVGSATHTQLHDIRLRAKKLRYAAEFFRGLFRRKRVDAFVDALSAIQDCLGSLNDAAMARGLLRELGRGGRRDAATIERASAIVTGWLSSRVQSDLRRLPRAWTAFIDQERFWT